MRRRMVWFAARTGTTLPRRVEPAVCLLLALSLPCGCSDHGAALTPPAPPAAPVEVAVAEERSVPVEVRAIGTVEAYSTVLVKSRVNGHLENVHFQEGQEVKKGDLLFQIDPRPFEAALRRTEANLARDEAQARNARVEAERIEKLHASNVASKDDYDVARTRAEALEATVRADQAAVEDTRLAVGYSTIRSPLDGRAGSVMVHEGNLVEVDETVLVTIHRISPIYVSFSVPQEHLPEVQAPPAQGPLRVAVFLPGEDRRPVEGDLTFVDNEVNAAAGTIRLKGTFANAERRLWPGQFVDVSLTLRVEPRAVVVPSAAVQNGQEGEYVFVIATPEPTAELRPITAGRTVDGRTVVERGLKAGEVVVTDGQIRLVPGARVALKPAAGGKQ